MPAAKDLFERTDDWSLISAMFGIRIQIWDGKTLSNQDLELWDAVKRQVPKWALFMRLSLSDEQRLARQEAERQVEQAFEPLHAEHDGRPETNPDQ